MSAFNPVLSFADGFIHWMSDLTGQYAKSYCDLETADDHYTLVAKDGSLLTVMRLDGSNLIIGNEEFNDIVEKLTISLQPFLASGANAIQVVFTRDPDSTKRRINDALKSSYETSKRLSLEVDDLLDEKSNHLNKFCKHEEVHLVLWTRPTGLSKHEIAQWKNESKENSKGTSPAKEAQNPLRAIRALRDRQVSFVDAVEADFKRLKYSAVKLEVHDALRVIRMDYDAEFTDPKWRASLPGDPIPARMKQFGDKKADISNILWPPLAWQVMPRNMEEKENKMLQVGDKIYAPMYIDIASQQVSSFQKLFSRVEAKVPWRFSFLIESNGMGILGFKKAMASILAFSNSGNKLIVEEARNLDEMEMDGETIVKLRMSFVTWAYAGQEEELARRRAALARSVEGWGYCDVHEEAGDVAAGFISTCTGMSFGSVATPSAAPLTDVVTMLPLARPASPWEQGSILFRSRDGKVWPYQPGSSKQTTWIDLIFAGPGSGKSVLLGASNLALCLAPGVEYLPRISIIDIGPSSSGFISLVKDALPDKEKHKAEYFRLQMTDQYAVNPFETQLGARFPMPSERGFMVNLLTLLATPIGRADPYPGSVEMSGQVLDETYKLLSDNETPRPYNTGVDRNIDEAIEQLQIKTDAHTTWWEVTDALFEKGDLKHAGLAQRFAVPTLADFISTSRNSPQVKQLYENVKTDTSESLVDSFGRMLSSAMREYPILAKPTQFDISQCRIVAMDLDEVAKSGGDAADRQTAVMYMLARYVCAKDYYLTENNLPQFPELYRPYHSDRIQEIRECAKRICFDEFHRTSKAQAVRDQVVVDMREGRKWNVQITLASQSVHDFDDNMIEFATSVFILSAGPNKTVEELGQTFGLTETAKTALKTYVHGPSKEGASFLFQFKTKVSNNTQLLTSTIGPVELWALSTTAEDVALRKKVTLQLGSSNARTALAKMFPGGSAKDEIEKMSFDMTDTGEIKEEGSVIEILAEKVVKFYYDHLTD